VHLEGSPAEIGFQHGYLLTPEIEDNFKVISTETSRKRLHPGTVCEQLLDRDGSLRGHRLPDR